MVALNKDHYTVVELINVARPISEPICISNKSKTMNGLLKC